MTINPVIRAIVFPDRSAYTDAMVSEGSTNFTIRSFRPDDLDACRHLYREGLIGGQIAENDSGLDIDDIVMAYMTPPGNHFWVAQTADGSLVGMIGVMKSEDGVAEIRRLRVANDHRRQGIGSALLETAIRFCQDNHYLKVALDTFIERDPAMRLFDKFRFRHGRTRTYAGRDLLFFYLDLYTSEPKPKSE